MNILYAATLYPPAVGGAQLHLHCLAKGMQQLGHNVRVITQGARNRTDWLWLSTVLPESRLEYTYEGVPVLQLGSDRWSRWRMLPWALAYYPLMAPSVRHLGRILERQIPSEDATPSVVHVSRIGREFLVQAVMNYCRRRDVPLVLTPNHHHRWRGWLYREYDKLYRQADAVVALTDTEKQLLIAEKRIPAERIHVTGIGPVLADEFSAEEFRLRYGLPDRFVLYLGQQLKYKGIGTLAAAMPHVWRVHPDVACVVVGPPTEYGQRVGSQLRDPRWINLGKVDLVTKTSALAVCELLCLPSTQESFGGVFVEAWTHRKPVIGGRIPQIAGVIDEGQDGLLANPDPEDLANQLTRLLSDPAMARSMGEAGWRKVQRDFTWESLARRTAAIYESLVGRVSTPDSAGVTTGDPVRESPAEVVTPSGLLVKARQGYCAGPASAAGRIGKVLLCHNFYQQTGGEDRSFEDEARLLAAHGHAVVKYTQHNDSVKDLGAWEVSRHAVWNQEVYDELRELIRRERPDIVHITNTFPLLSPAVCHAARHEGVPTVMALRNYRFLCLNGLFLRDGKVCEDCLGRAVAWPGVLHGCYRGNRPASAVVAVVLDKYRQMRSHDDLVDQYFTLTDFARQKFIAGGFDARRLHVKRNCVFPDPGMGRGTGGYAVFVGRLSREKGLETLLRGWSQLGGDLPLRIIGDGPLADLVRTAERDNPAVQWLGYRPLDEVLQIVGEATCLVMPSVWYETFGRTIAEAYAKGTPVIASRLGAMAELVEDGRTGLLFAPDDAEDMAAKVRMLLADPRALETMRQQARRDFETKYTAEHNYQNLINIYEQARESARRQAA